MPTRNQLVFYGDDFTGSTDALELLHLAGIRTALFPNVPTKEQLAAFEDLEAFGIAGTTRTMGPDRMRETLEPVFDFIRSINPRHCHYKVCSTFDSSPETGNIGVAMRVGAACFKSKFVPVLIGVPDLGRYCIFGHLFARLGTGDISPVYRLDRHPSMAHHPVTPARESDIRLRLKEQAGWETALFDIFHCRMERAQASEALATLLADGYTEAVLFDAFVESDLSIPGFLMEDNVPEEGTLFSVGSSAVEYALAHAWRDNRPTPPEPATAEGAYDEPILVLSGSCSPVTVNQIQEATKAGFAELALDTVGIFAGNEEAVISNTVERINRMMRDKKSAILHTYSGPDDGRTRYTRAAIRKRFSEQAAGSEVPRILGTAMGSIAHQVIEQTGLERIVVAGGDTSGHVAAAMGIEAMTVSQPFVRGAPFCRIHAAGSKLDGKEINFKGGQIGTPDYFIKAASHSQCHLLTL
ncbi:MAG: four-carbon acid sugar kinase family protein [Puniceicoccaceae bacterium]